MKSHIALVVLAALSFASHPAVFAAAKSCCDAACCALGCC
jgi:hypothetical protein